MMRKSFTRTAAVFSVALIMGLVGCRTNEVGNEAAERNQFSMQNAQDADSDSSCTAGPLVFDTGRVYRMASSKIEFTSPSEGKIDGIPFTYENGRFFSASGEINGATALRSSDGSMFIACTPFNENRGSIVGKWTWNSMEVEFNEDRSGTVRIPGFPEEEFSFYRNENPEIRVYEGDSAKYSFYYVNDSLYLSMVPVE